MAHPHDLASLARVALVPRLLHDVGDPDLRCHLAGASWASPVLRRASGVGAQLGDGLILLDAQAVSEPRSDRVPVIGTGRMSELMPEMRRLAALDVPVIALDLAPLGEAAPFGTQAWRPRSRDDLAELLAAAGRPVWLLGVASAEDAAIAAELGVEAIVVDASAGAHLGDAATADVLPEVVDAVAGMLRVFAGGAVGGGVDVLRLLALGADAVVVGGERPTAALIEELRYAMRLTGCAALADVGYDIVFAPLFGEP